MQTVQREKREIEAGFLGLDSKAKVKRSINSAVLKTGQKYTAEAITKNRKVPRKLCKINQQLGSRKRPRFE